MKLADIIKERSADFRDKICIRYEQQSCTYADLHQRACKAAEQLRKLGIKEAERIYLSGNNSIDLIVLFLALTMLEVDIVLIDPKSTLTEIQQLMQTVPA